MAVLDVSLTLLPRRQQERVSSAHLGGMAKAVLSAFESVELKQQRPLPLTQHSILVLRGISGMLSATTGEPVEVAHGKQEVAGPPAACAAVGMHPPLLG